CSQDHQQAIESHSSHFFNHRSKGCTLKYRLLLVRALRKPKHQLMAWGTKEREGSKGG
ncbi:unnamed protein product, partial [Musa acuminata subsp. burmannicoides]